jgi:predicted nucleic acid-binding protein
MLLIDTNVLMYAAGALHPCKEPSVRLLERVARGELEAAIDAETLREVLHRYRAIGRWDHGRGIYDLARQIFSDVVPVSAEILDRARVVMDAHPALLARDALHAAVVLQEGFTAICSYDRDFDVISSIARVEP